MKLRIGSHDFKDVQVPVLWGSRAILQDQQGRLSTIDLSGRVAQLEILGDEPAPGIGYVPTTGGFRIVVEGTELYSYNQIDKTLSSISLDLPDCQIDGAFIRVGSNVFGNNTVLGYGVGLQVTSEGVSLGAPMPGALAELVV